MIQEHVNITNIQRFSLNDGPGIRTTIFMKGCLLKCPWCCNPETRNDCKVPFFNNKVTNGIIKISDIYKIIMKDKDYYDSTNPFWYHGIGHLDFESLPGGVTYSGGEPMMQINKLTELLQKLNNENIHQVIETSLFCNDLQLKIAMEFIDLFYVDIKLLDVKESLSILKGDVKIFKHNFQRLIKGNNDLIIRIPLIRDYTVSELNRKLIKKLFDEVEIYNCTNVIKIELLKGHNLAVNKYHKLGIEGLENCVPSNKDIQNFIDLINQYNLKMEILTI